MSSTESKSSGAFAFPALPMLSARPETVVNPEGRGVEDGAPPSENSQLSSVWLRLFPQMMGSSDDYPLGELPTPKGFELGHFTIEERIGIGGMGAVFRAKDQRLQRVVALKVLGPTQSHDPSSVKRFQNEASAAARLDHDNIARVFYIGEDHGLHFIAFEYITGTNLRDIIRDGGPVSPLDAVNYTLQIAGALNHTHRAGVVHRDIKPSNIIITPNGRAKLVDLGLARRENSESVAELTMAGTTLGTFDYISPEQAKDPRTADVRSDIYSLGCTLYHALTGMPPYPEGTVLQKLLDHQGKEAPDPALKNRHIPRELSAICKKMMASDPKQRYATPEDLIHDFMPFASRLGLRALPADAVIWRHLTPPKESFWDRNLGWVASVAVLLVIVFVIWLFPNLGQTGRSSRDLATTIPSGRFQPTPKAESVDPPPNDKLPEVPKENTPAVQGDVVESPDTPTKRTDDEGNPLIAIITDPGGPSAKPPFGMKSVLDDGTSEVNAPKDVETETVPDPIPKVLPGETVEIPEVPGETQPPLPANPSRPFWIVHNDGSEDEGKLTLEAACTAAKDGQVVEIRHNGRLPNPISKPIRIGSKSLTLRAGENYRPLITFAGVESPTDGVISKLFHLSNASIDLINLDFEILPKRSTATDETWTLASLEGGGRVLLQNVTVTVDDPGGHEVAIVELLPPAAALTGSDMKMMNLDSDDSRPFFEVEIQDCLLRGSCDIFANRQTLPGRIFIENTAIAVEGSLLFYEGSLDSNEPGEEIELRLKHTTCVVGSGLIRIDTGDTPRDVLPITLSNSRDNLIATNTSNPLVMMKGRTDADRFRDLLRWDSRKNAYDGFNVFWAISSSGSVSQKFDRWVTDWSEREGTKDEAAINGGFAWQGNWQRMEFSDVIPADLALDRDNSNAAVNGATDGSDIGAKLDRLPIPPMREISER